MTKTPEEILPRCGACIFNYSGTRCLLVKQRGGKWGFPKGSKEHNESEKECMYREVLEETNLHLRRKRHRILRKVRWKQYNIFLIHLPRTIFWSMKTRDVQEIERISWVPIRKLYLYPLNYITKYVLYKKKYKNKIYKLARRSYPFP